MQNCWLLYQANKKTEDPTLDLLTFRRENVKTYLKKYYQPRSQADRPSRGRILPANHGISMDVGTDRVDHYQSHQDTQRKCGLCEKNTRNRCKNAAVDSTTIALKSGKVLSRILLLFATFLCLFDAL